MRYHILNGDGLAEGFPAEEIEGKVIVIRESFIEGPLSGDLNDEFWNRRIEFVFTAYGANKEDYAEKFMSQLKILNEITDDDTVFLWFEDDLFCLVNLLFTIYYLSHRTKAGMYRIFPKEDTLRWNGFGPMNKKELLMCFTSPQIIQTEDIALGNQLWEAYVNDDRDKLKALSFSDTSCFRFLPAVVQAHLERTPNEANIGRPQRTLIDILQGGKTNFYEIYEEFWKKDAIYGFGDLQVLNMLKEMQIEFSE